MSKCDIDIGKIEFIDTEPFLNLDKKIDFRKEIIITFNSQEEIVIDNKYTEINKKYSTLYKEKKITDMDFNMEEYYQYYSAAYYNNGQIVKNANRPCLFESNDVTWKYMLHVYSLAIATVFRVFVKINNVICLLPKHCLNTDTLCNMFVFSDEQYLQFVERMINEINYEKGVIVISNQIDRKYIAKHLKRSIHKIYNLWFEANFTI